MPKKPKKVTLDENSVVYQIVTDRFYDGDPSNNDFGQGEYKPDDLRFYQGGDWQGIIDKMNYIKNLGVIAIQISPIHHNQWISSDKTHASYHGYSVYDFYSPEPHFGTLEKLKELVEVAHRNGIAVILDAVPNHTADYLKSKATAYDSKRGRPAPPFDNPNWYHHHGNILDWEEEYQLVCYDLYDLDDLAQEVPEVEAELNKVYSYWINETGADGYRIDAAKHIPKWYLRSFQDAAGVPCYGEVWHGDPSYVSDYQRYIWGMEDIPLTHAIRGVFGNGKSCKKLKDIFDKDREYPNPNRLITFIDNHDMPRFLHVANGDLEKLKLALVLIFTARGIPRIFYGTEQGYSRGKDLDENRGLMNNWDENHPIHRYIRRLCDLRKEHLALRRGVQHEVWADDEVYVYCRIDYDEEIVVALNNSSGPQQREIPLCIKSHLQVGTILTNLLNATDEVTVELLGNRRIVRVSLEGKEAKIYHQHG